ncbi:MAG: hypothetical protein SVU88_01800 [Candidatus Nanohaloarchaea archaeon]|nr:hypothetical protein [Candidatus Nanohaloarchaea archaeon]
MDLGQLLKRKLAEYPTTEFHVDEHALRRCEDYRDLDIEEVLHRLRTGRFDKVVRNDSRQGALADVESYKARLPKSSRYKYEVVLYLTRDKPLIKTVSKLDRTAQERIDDD